MAIYSMRESGKHTQQGHYLQSILIVERVKQEVTESLDKACRTGSENFLVLALGETDHQHGNDKLLNGVHLKLLRQLVISENTQDLGVELAC